MSVVRLGTRRSALAMAQSSWVAERLRSLGHRVTLVPVVTEGDLSPEPLVQLGGTGVFVSALRDALLAGEVDLAVHSLKDLPTAAAPGLVVAAVPPREDPRDVLVAGGARTLDALPTGARVGTGSPRRAAQLRAHRPDLEVVDVRGNVDTRVGYVTRGELDAVVLARAGLARLGRLDVVTEVLGTDVMLPAPGQGALALEVRAPAGATDPHAALHTALGTLDDRDTRAAVTAERAVLAGLEAGCSAPVGALGCVDGSTTPQPTITLEAVLADGAAVHRMSISAPLSDAGAAGHQLAARLLAAADAVDTGEVAR